MNPLTNVRNIVRLNDNDLRNGIFDHQLTWHSQYKDSAYIFIGGLPYDLSEGDILCVFSQYGEIVNLNLVRDKKTGKSKGYGFICYEDQRSTILAVDNLNNIKLGGRTIRVDHVTEYRAPKGDEKDENGKFKEKMELGCAPKTPSPVPSEDELLQNKRVKKKKKKEKKKKKKKDEYKSEDSSDEKITKKQYPDKYNKQVAKDSSDKQTLFTDKNRNGSNKVRSRSNSRERFQKQRSRSNSRERFQKQRSRSYSRERFQKQRSRSNSEERFQKQRSRSNSRERFDKRKEKSRTFSRR